MKSEREAGQAENLDNATAAHFVHDDQASDTRAWEEIEPGRFMPRRIKGSSKGRALG